MAYKLIKANPEASAKSPVPSTGLGASKYQGASSFGGYLGQQVAGAAARVAELPGTYGDILRSGLEYVSNQPPPSQNPQELPENRARREQVLQAYKQSTQDLIPSQQGIRKGLENLTGAQEGYLDPRGIIGNAAEMTVNALPLTLLFGSGALGSRIAQDFASSLAMSTAKAAKLPAVAQIASGMLINPLLKSGARGIQNLFRKEGTKKVLNPLGLEATGNKIAHEYSIKRDELGKNLSIDSNKYIKSLDEVGNKVAANHFMSEEEQKGLYKIINGLKSDAIGTKIGAESVIKNKQLWNETYPELFKKSDSYQQYANKIKSILEDTRKEIGIKSPQWYQASKVVDDITKAKNLNFTATQLLNGYPQAKKFLGNSLIQTLLSGGIGSGTGALVSGLAGAATGAALGTGVLATSKLALNKAEKIVGFLLYPGARQVAQEVVKSIVNEKTPELIRNLTKLNSLAEQYEKKSVNKPISSEKTHYKLIKAGHGF